MFTNAKKLLAAALFTIVLIVIVNVAWWIFYDRTETLLDNQLSRRLTAIAATTAISLETAEIEQLVAGDFNSYARIAELLEEIRSADTLSELFILDENYSYLVTTSLEADSVYFLSALNGPYIDSLFFGFVDKPLSTQSYKTGQVYLKSAFAPLYDSSGLVLAVLGVEANVDYFDALTSFKENLLYSTTLSLVGGLILGIIFLLVQRRLNYVQQHLFLNETHAYLGRMVAMVSHEIKNPLMIIRASAERLKKRANDKESQSGSESDFIVEEVDRLNEIVTGYLNYATSAGEKGSFIHGQTPESFSLDELFGSLKKHVHQKYPTEKINWIESPAPTGLKINSYKRALRQVLLNILINGAQACQSAGRPIEIGLEASMDDQRAIITVIDHGPGMSPKQVKKIFEPFYTTRQTGSGLGLYVSKKIVEEMGGKIIIHSVEGEGTKVTLNLPKEPGK